LQAEAAFFERFVLVQADDPKFQAERAEAYYRLGSIVGAMGNLDAAIGHFHTAMEIDDRLMAADPADVGPRQHPARCLNGLADIYRNLNRTADARAALGEAQDIVEGLLRQQPGDPAQVCQMVDILLMRCLLAKGDNNAAEAEAGHRKSESLLLPLVKADPG